MTHFKIDEPYTKKAFQSSNKSEAPNQKNEDCRYDFGNISAQDDE